MSIVKKSLLLGLALLAVTVAGVAAGGEKIAIQTIPYKAVASETIPY